MLRIPVFLLALWLAAPSAADPVASALPKDQPRLILYVDADSVLVNSSIRKFEAALGRRGHRVAVRHVPVDVFNRQDTANRIAAALRDRPELVVDTSSESAGISKEVTSEVPILFASHQDPVRLGLVRSFANPGANVTGFTSFAPIDLKRLELLRELDPRARRLGIVIDHWWMKETDGAAIIRAAKAQLGFDAQVFLMEKPEDLRQLHTQAARGIDAWYVPTTTLPFWHTAATVKALAALGKPVVYPTARFTELGGLAAYQPRQSLDEALDLLGKLAGHVLDGVAPAMIPVERPNSFDLILNASAARRIGIRLPDALLKRADRVIDDTRQAASR